MDMGTYEFPGIIDATFGYITNQLTSLGYIMLDIAPVSQVSWYQGMKMSKRSVYTQKGDGPRRERACGRPKDRPRQRNGL